MANRFPQTILLGRNGSRRLAANPLSYNVLNTQKPKRMNSLSSPMFPQMPVPEPAFPKADVPKGEEDFMSRYVF
jgi:hypothetical protein